MDDLVSVIIPTYCRSTTLLNNAVQSVIQQKETALEIIIVDDNKDSLLSEEIKVYCATNNLIYMYSNNIGASGARNVGIQFSKGKYIAFLDDDDVWLPDKLLMQIPFFDDPTVGLVYSRGYTYKIGDDGSISKSFYATDNYYKSEVNYKDLLQQNYIGTTTQFIVRRDALIQIGGFDETLPSRQDYDLCLRISQYYRCVGSEKYLFIHYKHSEKQITANAHANMKGYQMVFKKYKKDIFLAEGALRKWCCRIARCALSDSSYVIFLVYFLWALLDNPLSYKDTIRKILN